MNHDAFGGGKAATIAPELFLGLFLFFVFGLGCSRGTVPPAASPAPLVATRFTGTCEIQTNSNPWTLLLTNQPVQAGSRLRTGTNSFLELTAISNPYRIVLAHDSEAVIDRWAPVPRSSGADEEIQIDVRHGLVLLDLPPISAVSKFEVKGTNFVAGVRAGAIIAAINADGAVLVQAGTIVCVLISPPNPPISVIVNPGQMLDPVAKIAKRIPGASNEVWNLLTQ